MKVRASGPGLKLYNCNMFIHTLSFHLMNVLSLLSFAERLYKASNIGLFWKTGKKHTKLPERGIEPQISVWKAGLLTNRPPNFIPYMRHYKLWLVYFYPIFKDHIFVFKEVFSQNSVLMYGLYSRAACNQERYIIWNMVVS